MEGPFEGTDAELACWELGTWLNRFRSMFQGYSRWREVLSHLSAWMFWKALGGSVLASCPLVVQELPGDGLSSKLSSDSISLTKMERKVSTTPTRYRFNICFIAERIPVLCRAAELSSASGRPVDAEEREARLV